MMVEKELGRARRHGIVRSTELYQTGLLIWGGLSRVPRPRLVVWKISWRPTIGLRTTRTASLIGRWTRLPLGPDVRPSATVQSQEFLVLLPSLPFLNHAGQGIIQCLSSQISLRKFWG